ncbi:flagellar type III secretion system pore protein FliP [Clostridium minihomine]|uniref:flagellar type III secretion system pore protein FliP n=1 Tax=Clostridium minihomine TaxID=2045012 RepID=UPI000C76370C|nr:flagellar type III secretion system pore protein FliP [Clostridium minihomine]
MRTKEPWKLEKKVPDETKTKKTRKKCLVASLLSLALTVFLPLQASATTGIQINGDGVDTLQILQMFLILALAPSILIMTTCFTRIVIVLSFLRNALGLQQTPPNQVLIGMALFLSLFIMSPVLTQINEQAYQPYREEQITQEEFIAKASVPMKEFMLKQTKKDDLNLFLSLSKTEIDAAKEAPLTVVIPAFMTSELRRAFLIGFLIFIPFLIIDMVVSSTLMSMGMIMLPPAIISLPFKLLLFVLVDGWGLLFKTLVAGFNV